MSAPPRDSALAIGDLKLTTGNWNWKLAAGNWKLETGN
jgi:hypothetical protein